MMSLAMVAFVVNAFAGGKKPQHHNSGHSLIADKLKSDGNHPIDRKGKHAISADVKNGKIAAFHVRHDTKGEIAVKKYKSKKKVAALEGQDPDTMPAQTPAQTDLGLVWIAYAYVDDDGNEEYYWFQADEILDGDTGAVEYVPVG
jgi:hypothetical protein